MDQYGLEREFGKLRRRSRTAVWATLLSVAAFVILLKTKGPVGFVLLIPAVLSGILAKRWYDRYRSFYKEQVVRPALKSCSWIEALTYQPEAGLPASVAADAGILRGRDSYESNDRITGSVYGVNFTLADVKSNEIWHIGENRHTDQHTVFAGRWLTFDSGIRIPCTLQLLSGKLREAEICSGLTETASFDEDFRLYTDDEQAAWQVLTPLVQGGLKTWQKTAGVPVMVLYRNGTVHAVLETGRDSYEGGEGGSRDLDAERRLVVEDMQMLTDFISCWVRSAG